MPLRSTLIAFFLAALAALFPLHAAAQPATAAVTPPPGMTQVTSVEGITEYRLANGLQVLLVPDDSKPTTTVNVTYRVGSRHENYGETGMAHLLEHLVFKGTPTTKNVWAEFTRRGLRANGSTWTDRTNYFASFSANDANLQWYLSWQADIMVNSFIAKSDLDTEMTVVRNEFESGENNPGRVLFQRVLSGMYDWHNYGKSTIGARTDIENVDIARLQAFYKLHYQPDNATLVVTGKYDTAQVMGWIAKYFGELPKPQRTLQPTYTQDPPQDGERLLKVKRVGGAPLIYMAYHTPPGAHPDAAAVQLLGGVLGDTPGGRLHKRVVEQRLAAQSFGAVMSWAESSPLLLGVGLAPGQSVDQARSAMGAVLDGLQAQPVTAEELERARIGWLNGWDLGFTDPESVGVAMSEAIAQGDWRLYFLLRDRVRAVTLADMTRVAQQWLKPDNRTVAIYEPTAKPERAPQMALVDVAAQVKGYQGDPSVAVAEAFDPSPANIDARSQHAQLPGSIKFTLLPKATRGRVVHARLALHFGTEKSLFGHEAAANLAGSLLDKGGAGLSRQQIADQLDKLQAQLSFSAGGQSLFANITTKREHLPAVIELAGRLLRQPAFDAGPLEEARKQWLASLEAQRKEPAAVIANRLARHGNPYPRGDLRHAQSFEEEEQDVRAVTLQQIKDFHRRFYSAGNGEFAAVGDMDAGAVRQALQAALVNWRQPSAGPQPYVRLVQPAVLAPPARFVEQTPDKANANLAGRLTLPINDRHPDFAALSLGNTIFGFLGNSRLWKRIRETEGLSYDVRSGLNWGTLDENTGWTFSAIFAPQNQARVEIAFREELARSVKDGFTQAELDEARVGLLNFRRLSRAQDASLASQLAGNLYVGRRFDFAQQTDDAIARLTLADINAAWRRHIDADRLVLAWGGDFKAP
ncbi:MAG: insulinase family protein [Rubrivivax sp.]|nr:insulinase family protein [Rubrivivax sp.]